LNCACSTSRGKKKSSGLSCRNSPTRSGTDFYRMRVPA
jgi:hypothetical protein